MATKPMTREQIIDLINQYIYTNGLQRISAAQLNEILIDMATSFAIEGGASSGLDAVLETGSTVSENREITNENGGAFKLDAELTIGETIIKYIGMNFNDGLTEGAAYVGKDMSAYGNRRLPEENRTDNTITEAITFYNLNGGPKFQKISGRDSSDLNTFSFKNLNEDSLPTGIVSFVNSDNATSGQLIQSDQIDLEVRSEGDENTSYGQLQLSGGYAAMYVSNGDSSANMNIYQHRFDTSIYGGPQSSSHNQSSSEFNWRIHDSMVGPQSTIHTQSINEFNWKVKDSLIMVADFDGLVLTKGLTLREGNKLTLSSGGSAPTSGRATLITGTGSAFVATTAVNSDSVISLTVQESGEFKGNIRVFSKSPNMGFVISSSDVTDTCEVFWQIIDL
ncbi:MAG: hypothetical protein FGM14_12490 [Flavobacteriales bacterium]|nr:hypothetical protein [Flavobacteriales bacterium]